MGDVVQARNYLGNRKWTPGTIIQQTGPVSARIKLENGDVVWRHHDQLLARESQPIEELVPPSFEPELPFGNNARSASPQRSSTTVTQCGATRPQSTETPEFVRRYPARERKPPERYE